MVSIEELFKDNKYPRWITNNPVFSKLDYVRKIFPSIDLPNFEVNNTVDNSQEVIQYAYPLLNVVLASMHQRQQKLIAFAKRAQIGKERRQNVELILHIIQSVVKQLISNNGGFITVNTTGKISLSVPTDIIYNEAIVIKAGSGLFKAYEKLNLLLKNNKFLTLPQLSDSNEFKSFSSVNIPSKEISIRFSSEGSDGIWDIATMSMRGINSCQTWDNGISINGLKVIGSMIDPFTGIIYSTHGTPYNTYGTKMVRRCIVRYVIDHTTKEPFLLLEKMYPAFDHSSLNSFIKALQSKAPNIPIHYSANLGTKANYGTKLAQVYIPLSDEMKMLEPQYYPYCDSAIIFKEDTQCKFTKNIAALHLSLRKQLPLLFTKAILSKAFTKVNLKPYGEAAADTMAQLRIKGLKKGVLGANTKQVCKCKRKECNRAHSTAELKELTIKIAPLATLSAGFADFICPQNQENNDLTIISKKHCSDFLNNKLADLKSQEFIEYVSSNVYSYVAQNVKI